MRKSVFVRHQIYALESAELREVEQFFDWALSYERKGLKIAADAMRDEGRKAYERFLADRGKLAQA